ncbi:hypothetical protein DFR29_12245 [Tahibacter aquaticus]|uniref:Parallel beta helix pectate lyase-like protein n=1 Tax=Tahibacter aquaticus TaxID=520092 RepID=A0A4R6YLT2_9GAMM|nr:hypothetical protein [Tahibacter aquaticus]TDR38245.1 hypothetical protein DFR29_12245 [Tahibacter aquaticus]
MRFTILKLSALAGALAAAVFAAPVSHAAVRFSEATDALYSDATHGGRGWVVDYIPRADGSGILYLYGAAYDETGKQAWITSNFEVKEFEFKKTDVPMAMPTGGRFGDTWPNAVTPVVNGKLDVELLSCGELKITVKPDAATGLPTSTQTLISSADYVGSLGVNAVNDKCVQKRKFSACPTGTTLVADRTCQITGTIASNMTLTNETTWVLKGLVKVGADNSNKVKLTIEPGTLITGSGQAADYLYVEPGSQIIAAGTPYAPIIFTSPADGVAGGAPKAGDWGGVVVSGNAPNNKCVAAPFDCRSEFDPTLRYGGDKPRESSGVIQYVQSRYAGYIFQTGREVNSFTFQSVGDGTVVDHIQAYRGKDDGIEFFGGNVNVKHAVITEAGDDGLDWDEGYTGNIQYVLLQHGTGLGEDNGIEASNQNANQDALPRATPNVSNLTMLGNGQGGYGVYFKEGTGGRIKNSLFAGFKKGCTFITNGPTFTAAGTPAALTGTLSMDHNLLACDALNFAQAADAPWTAEAFYNAQAGNKVGDPLLQGFLPKAGSPLLDSGLSSNNVWFTPVGYIGAFRDASDDWTRNWTTGLTR